MRSTEVGRGLSLGGALKLVREFLRGRRGALAILRMNALSEPAREAIVSDTARLTWAAYEARVCKLTHGLRALGVGPGAKVALFLHNGHEALELAAAIAALGGVTVQIGYRLKAPEVAYLIENSGARALFYDHSLASVVDELGGTLPRIATGAPYEALIARGSDDPVRIDGGGYGATMVYTSGTTGRSKGAERDYGAMGLEPALDMATKLGVRRDERHLVACPLYHSLAPAFATLVNSVGGCNLVLRDFDPEAALALIERERATSTVMVPTMFARIVALPKERFFRYDLRSLRWILSGSAPLPTELARAVEDRFGPILYNMYGATETGLVTLACPGEHTARPGTIGRALSGNELRLIDAEGRAAQFGELFVRNPLLMVGYHGDARATADITREGFLSVGDIARRDADGFYYIVDRKSDMVISGGVNIYPWEIEQRLYAHPAVREVAVVGVPSVEWGESLTAFVVRRAEVTPEELTRHVTSALADYKKPRRFVFVDELPRNALGKISKRHLRAAAPK